MANIDQEFVEFVVKSLVNEPDKVQVERSIDEKGVLLQLTVGPEDLGRVIGKRGNTAQSIRTLLRALGTKNDARYNLKIVDPEGGERPQRERRSDNDGGGDGFASAGAVGAAVVANDATASASNDDDSAASPSDGASQWAHLSSSDDDSDDDASTDENASSEVTEENEEDQSSSVVEKTREELADLDGLDI